MDEIQQRNIILYGVPGSGKTSLGQALSEELKLFYIEADEIRKIGKQNRSLETDPFFFLPTTEAYQAIGECTGENIIKGLFGVRGAYRDLVHREVISHEEPCIIEAAFLDPIFLKNEGLEILVVVSSEEKHRQQFFTHRTEDALTERQFKNARIIQDFLIREAGQVDTTILENDGDIKSLVEKLKKL
ncbi:MAG: AAA family ATPase [Parcubacteria group bacterium]|nr:AAA family ATPase [Parcubacteria group bacterium]